MNNNTKFEKMFKDLCGRQGKPPTEEEKLFELMLHERTPEAKMPQGLQKKGSLNVQASNRRPA